MPWKMLCTVNFYFFSVLDCLHLCNHFSFSYALS